MELKSWVWAGLFVGSTIGSYLPTLFGADLFSTWSIVGSTVGGILGIWGGYVLGQKYS